MPVYKNGDKTDCSNFMKYIEEITGDHQCGFKHNRSPADQIFCTYQILRKNRSTM